MAPKIVISSQEKVSSRVHDYFFLFYVEKIIPHTQPAKCLSCTNSGYFYLPLMHSLVYNKINPFHATGLFYTP